MKQAIGTLVLAGMVAAMMAPAAAESQRYNTVRSRPLAYAKWTIDKLDPKYRKQEVSYQTAEQPGTIIVETKKRFLYLVLGKGKALRYGIGVGRAGFVWKGEEYITKKKEWPDWRPPMSMQSRDQRTPEFMKGGPDNPLGARALYLGETEYRIHGTPQPWTVGTASSSGCVVLTNEDVSDLYERVPIGTKVIVN